MRRRLALLAALLLASSTFIAGCDDDGDNNTTPDPDVTDGDTIDADVSDGMDDGDSTNPGDASALPGILGLQVDIPSGADLSSSADAPSDDFFESAPYLGAVDPDSDTPWYDGWTNFENGEPLPTSTDNIVTVDSDITSDTTWTSDNVYSLESIVFVTGDSTLTIEPGTLIVGQAGTETTRPGGLVVTNGSTLEASGDEDNPIIFTSAQDPADRQAGDWAGVVLLGDATLNVDGGTNSIEGLDPSESKGEYGGSNDAHDCGTVEYVRIEFAGDEFAQDEELNGLTLGGCGSETTVNHVQVHRGLDDGIEIFGGTLDLRYVIASEAGDDGLDFDEGFRGRVQYALASSAAISDSPRAFEWDNQGDDFDAEPRTDVTLFNGTIYQTTESPTDGMRLREGVGGEIANVLVLGTEVCAGIRDNSPIFVHDVKYYDPSGAEASCLGEFEPLPGVDRFNFTLLENVDLTSGAAEPGTDYPVSDATYFGAADLEADTQWYEGWTNFTNGESLPSGSDNIITVDSDITSDTTWTSDNVYSLESIVFVTGDSTLTIEPGTLIVGQAGTETTRPGGLVVTSGSTLEASGEEGNPIVFTSAQAKGDRQAGDWAGVVLLGDATLNVDGGTNSIEGLDPSEAKGEYGGSDDAHDCGTIEYVRIEFAGDEFAQDEELNGLTFGGCGTGTTVNHVQVHRGLDDNIEVFGGTFDMSYLVVSEAGDDALDLDEGYRGNIQFVLASTAAISDSPRAFEWDNQGDDFAATPVTTANLSNVTIYKTVTDSTEGMRLREGVDGMIQNVLMLGNIQTCSTIADSSPIDVDNDDVLFFTTSNSSAVACYSE
jgi:hypothetical protein